MTQESPLVGIVAVSHSRRIAEGVVELARQMAGDEVRLEGIGGQPDGSIGTDADGIAAAIERAQAGSGVVVVADLGSAILATESALELLGPERTGPVIISSGPLVEGAVVAAVQASIGQSMEEVVAAADAARDLDKGVNR
jgi:dihydroxyacetone kinase phosphotransfer subunit